MEQPKLSIAAVETPGRIITRWYRWPDVHLGQVHGWACSCGRGRAPWWDSNTAAQSDLDDHVATGHAEPHDPMRDWGGTVAPRIDRWDADKISWDVSCNRCPGFAIGFLSQRYAADALDRHHATNCSLPIDDTEDDF